MEVTVNAYNVLQHTTIKKLWAVHSTQPNFTNPDWLCVNDLAPEGHALVGSVLVVAGTEDYWSFVWLDNENKLWSTGFFKFKLLMNAGDQAEVQWQISNTIALVQGNNSSVAQKFYLVGDCPGSAT